MFLFPYFLPMNLSSIGALLFSVGAISSVLTFTDYELKVLFWVNTWGEGMAWTIRAGLILVGAILFVIGARNSGDEDNNEEEK